jgi:hypothetical protein
MLNRTLTLRADRRAGASNRRDVRRCHRISPGAEINAKFVVAASRL